MSKQRVFRPRLTRIGVAIAVMCAGGAAALPGTAAAVTCTPIAPFAAGNFHSPTRIDNTFMPLVPGTRFTLDGRANRGGGPLPHQIVLTVTDLTKTIGGVRTAVLWDVDVNQGQVVESELAFFAQDDAGNVWNLGEYPEEYELGAFIGAPSTWIHGLRGAEGGVQVPGGQPVVSSSYFLEGSAPDVEFLDCARIAKVGQTTTVPAGTFQNVMVAYERSPLDPASGAQTKYYAPGVGNVQVGAINDPEGETLVLSSVTQLTPDALAAARQGALALDARGYQASDVYGQTTPVELPASAQPPAQPAQSPPSVAVKSVTISSALALTSARARGAIRRALLSRLHGWTITKVACGLKSGRATCQVAAKRRGFKLAGSATVTRRSTTSNALRYRLSVRIVKAGCHPVASRSCTRKALWAA